MNFDICSYDYSIVLRLISSCLANYIQPRLSRIYVLIYFDFENMLLVDQHTLVSYIKTENVCRQFEGMFFLIDLFHIKLFFVDVSFSLNFRESHVDIEHYSITQLSHKECFLS